MDFSPQFQKLCQVETRRLVMAIGMVASLILVIQFLSLPYGNLLLTLLPAGKLPFAGKGSFATEDSASKSAVITSSFNINDTNLTDGYVRNTLASDMEEETKHANDAKRNAAEQSNGFLSEKGSPVGASEQGELKKPNIKSSPEKVVDLGKNSHVENVESPYNGSISENAREPGQGNAQEQIHKTENGISLGSTRKEDTGLRLDRTESGHIASGSSPLAFAPVVSTNVPTLPRKLDVNSSTSLISVYSNISSVGKQSKDKFSKDERPELLKRLPVTSNNSSTITNNPNKGQWKMSPGSVMSISEMNLVLLENRDSSVAMKPRWSSARDQEILSAKSQIQNAALIKKEDPQLFSPLFRNVSMFKRSYELMEQTLKVYVYREGAKPVFHQPIVKGIYASEGWFMKQMEGNKQFVVKNPKRAHLFYLPFSTRMLEKALYVPNSHSSSNLVQYLKDYINMLSAKYSFWNRTGGADHFLVACHDWAPTETRHTMSNTIRALCNADVHEGFIIGKDVSLPETLVHNAKVPSKDPGGKPPSQRRILAFFAGNMHGYVRPILLKHWENKDPDMKIFGPMGRKTSSKMNYIQHMKSSKYCICAKGYEVNSPRVVEAILYECVPVIISDNYVPPFFEVLDWEAFAVFVPEKDIPNLKDILLSIPQKRYLMMHMRIKKLQQHFMWHTKPVKYDIFHMILHSVWYNRVFQLSPR